MSPPGQFDAVVASDLDRAAETAGIIASALNFGAVELFPGLREQHQGAWTGLAKPEIKRRWPDRYRQRPRHPVGGETAGDVVRRAWRSLARFRDEHTGGCVLVVTHAGVIREVERALGCVPSPIPHLEGRWLELGEPDNPTDPWVTSRGATAARQVLGDATAEAPRAGELV
jgi:broad specificity phosphatase PhoE